MSDAGLERQTMSRVSRRLLLTGMDSVAFAVLALIGLTGFTVCLMLRQHVSFRRPPIERSAAVAR